MARLLLSILMAGLFFTPALAEDKKGYRFGSNSELRYMRPEKPVKIKLKRGENGTYTWELTGDNARKIIDADRKLRKYLENK